MSLVAREPVKDVANERLWDLECAGKDRYPSETAAEFDLARIKGEGTMRKTCWLETYRCSSCREWHIGNGRRLK